MEHTDTMKPIGRRQDGAESMSGLVLLYADEHASLPTGAAIEGGVLVIGRDAPPGGLRIPIASISRLHARIARTATSGFTITDLGSRNGTFVDGVRVRETSPLASGSIVRIGDAMFELVTSLDPRALAYRIDGSMAPGAARLSPAGAFLGGLATDIILAEIAKIAATDLPVLILGETGTGKEVLTQTLHGWSKRKGQLSAINCAAIPPALLESELFGVRKGAFTGADRDRVGLVRAADGGTLLLDEIGDMPLEAQAKLLRLIETREVLPLGAASGQKVDVRLVCATHHDLVAQVAAGTFRADLHARINGYTVTLPPLRRRRADLYSLTRAFIAESDRPSARPTFAFMAAVCTYEWPYNVRELVAAVRRAVAVSSLGGSAPIPPSDELDEEHLPDPVRDAVHEGAGSEGARPTDDELRALCEKHAGNVSALARAIDKDRAQVHRWLKRAGIDVSKFR